MNKIDELLSTTPHKPGCYLMKDKNGCIIYVGKSKNLKNRLSSYFKQSHTGKTMMLVRDIDTYEGAESILCFLREKFEEVEELI